MQAEPKDIEEIAALGKAANVCPYYAARKATKQAELVTLPYNLLLQKTARESLGLNIKDQIIVIDEAHSELLSSGPQKFPFMADLVLA